MLKYSQQIGWQYVRPPESLSRRGDETGLYFSDILTSQLQKLNPGVVDPSRASEILRKLNLLRPSIEGNRMLSPGCVASSRSLFLRRTGREMCSSSTSIILITTSFR
jgi:hypothetical protein